MACIILASPPSTQKPMTDNIDSNRNLTRTPGPTRLLWGGSRLTYFATAIGCAMFFWGLYEPMNGPLIVLGAAVVAASFFLRNRTQFGRPGRPLVEEEFVRQPDGSVKDYKLRMRLSKLEILLHATGLLLVLLGVVRSINWYLILSGILLAWTAQLYGNRLWFRSSTIGFSDSLLLAYEKLRNIGDEVRGEGYVVRRVENGIRYIESSRSLTLRSGWAFVEKERIHTPDGSITTGDKLQVIIRMNVTSKRRWDAPHDGEKIPKNVLFEISGKTAAALNSHVVFHVNG
jgi:hypothetical protein